MNELLDFVRASGMCAARNGFELRDDGKIVHATLPKLRTRFEVLSRYTEIEIRKAIQTVKREI